MQRRRSIGSIGYIWTQASKNLAWCLLSSLLHMGAVKVAPNPPLIFALVGEPLSQAIRSHPDIAGLSVDQTFHKIVLYADDIIIWLTDPLKSLPPLCDLLQRFSQVSMYKLNHSKWAMLGVSLSPWLRTVITTTSPFSWVPNSSMNYLDIQLTSPSAMLLRTNITLLGQKLQDTAKTPLSQCLLGRAYSPSQDVSTASHLILFQDFANTNSTNRYCRTSKDH